MQEDKVVDKNTICGNLKYKQKFYVVFKDTGENKWWNFLLDKNFKHCFLLFENPVGGSIVINPSEGGMGVYFYAKDAKTMAADARFANFIVVEYITRGMETRYFKFFRTCVGICKDFLGIHKWWIITPKQLYREVAKNG